MSLDGECPTRRTYLKVVIAVIAIGGAVAAALVANRWIEYRRNRPMLAGISALKAGDFEVARRTLTPFAEAGNDLARRTLGQMYAFGEGVPVDDIQAAMWFRRADCSCSAPGRSEYDVALGYLQGTVVARDPAMAAKWLRTAAAAGNHEAQRLLIDSARLRSLGLSIDPAVSDYWRKVHERR